MKKLNLKQYFLIKFLPNILLPCVSNPIAMKKYSWTLILIIVYLGNSFCQGSGIPLGNETYQILDRLAIKLGKAQPFHPSLKYYERGDVVAFAFAFDTLQSLLSPQDQLDLEFIFDDNNEWLATSKFPTTIAGKRASISDTEETLTQVQASMRSPKYHASKKPFLKQFYKTPANFWEVNDKFFHMRVNPLLNLQLANAQDDEDWIYLNRRGFEARGGIDDRVFFYLNLLESQARFPNYIRDYIKEFQTLPGEGLYKGFENTILGFDDGHDYLNSQGYMAFSFSEHSGMQFGYGKNFIGNGYRSLMLSDFSNNYLYLKLNWKVWRFHYQNIFAELSAESANSNSGDNLVAKKYMATHHLSFNILPNLNIGVFESVIFSRENQFELQYLNPIIFYRTVEQGLGSPDNVILGIDGRWDFLQHFRLYGQFIIDEFKSENVFGGNGWWANKFGLQTGMKYINAFGIDHFDLQLEYNSVRPYTYTHSNNREIQGISSYTHFNQPLAHPLGANFREQLIRVRYQPFRKWIVEARFISAEYGEDPTNTNFGGNILLPNNTREMDFGNEIGQGINTQLAIVGLNLSYRLAHNVYLDANYFYRNNDSSQNDLDLKTQYLGGGIRINLAREYKDF